MPRTNEQFKQMKEDRISSIMESSLVLYSLYGNKITIDQIAERSKCSHGIVYHYFKNTDEIIDKLLRSDKYIELKKSLIKSYAGVYAKDALKNIMVTLVNLTSVEDIGYGNIIINERDKKSLYPLMCSLVERGQKEGDVTGGDSKDIIQVAFLLLKGIYLDSLLKKHPEKLRPSLDNIMEIFRKKR